MLSSFTEVTEDYASEEDLLNKEEIIKQIKTDTLDPHSKEMLEKVMIKTVKRSKSPPYAAETSAMEILKYLNISLEKYDLSKVNIENAGLECADLRNGKLMNSNLMNVNLDQALLSNCDLQNCNLLKVQVSDNRDFRKGTIDRSSVQVINDLRIQRSNWRMLFQDLPETQLSSSALKNQYSQILKHIEDTLPESSTDLFFLSPDKTYIAWEGPSFSINLFDKNQIKLFNFQAHTLTIKLILFSFDQKCFASCSEDNTVKIWSSDTNKLIRTIKDSKITVNLMVFSHDSRLIAHSNLNFLIFITEIESIAESKCLEGSCERVKSMSFSPNNQYLASISKDFSLIIWSVKGYISYILRKQCIFAIFSLDGRHILKYFLKKGELKSLKRMNYEMGPQRDEGVKTKIISVAFSTDEQILATLNRNSIVKIWDMETGNIVKYLQLKLKNQRKLLSIGYSPQRGFLVIGSNYNNDINIYELNTDRITSICIVLGCKRVKYATFSWDSSLIALAIINKQEKMYRLFQMNKNSINKTDFEMEILVLDTNSSEKLSNLKDINECKLFEFSFDNRYLCYKDIKTKIFYLWNWAEGMPVELFHSDFVNLNYFDGPKNEFKFSDLVSRIEYAKRKPYSKPSGDMCICFAPDNKIVISAVGNMTLYIYDIDTKEISKSILIGYHNHSFIKISPDRKHVVSIKNNWGIILWKYGFQWKKYRKIILKEGYN